MGFNKKDVIIGFLIIVTLVAGFLIYKKVKTPKPLSTKTPASFEYREDFADTFRMDIPEGSSLIELKDVNGGDSRGIVTKTEILVDTNDPKKDHFYQVWLEKDSKLTSLGKMTIAKGGWILEYSSSENSQGKIIVSQEKVFDNNLEQKILEGTF
jgi:hypothetical protein